eukprot:gene12391-3049_t
MDEAVELASTGEHNNIGMVHHLPDLTLEVKINKTKGIQPNNVLLVEYIVDGNRDIPSAENAQLLVEFPYPNIEVTYAEEVQKLSNLTTRLSHDVRLVNISLQNVSTEGSRIHIADLYSYKMESFVNQDIQIYPEKVEGGSKINATVTLRITNSTDSAFNLTLNVTLDNGTIDYGLCVDGKNQQLLKNADLYSFTSYVGIFKAEENISCNIYATIGERIVPGGQIKLQSVIYYYHKVQEPNLYPIDSKTSKHLIVSAIQSVVNSSLNLSALEANSVFTVDITFIIPRGLSNINITITLPTYEKAIRSKRSVRSISSLQPLLEFVPTENITYTNGAAIMFLDTPVIQRINSTVLIANFGEVNSSSASNVLYSEASIRLKFWLKVANDPLNIFGKRSEVSIVVGSASSNIPFQITGPLVNPSLKIQKTVQVKDASRASPLLKFTVVVQHNNDSRVSALNITITDLVDTIAVYTLDIQPRGKLSMSNLGSIITITGFVSNLPVSNNVTMVYTGSFFTRVQAARFQHKASVTWRSVQVNNFVLSRKTSKETCLLTSKKVTKKTKKAYELVALGVALGIIFGILAGLLVLYCVRRTRVGKTYVFLESLNENEIEEDKMDKNKESRKSFRLETLIGRKDKQSKKSESQKLDGDKWALMIVANSDAETVERSRSRTLMEELVRGYDNSFKFFVDTLSQIATIFSNKLRMSGDISAETLRKIQSGANTIMSNYVTNSKVIDHNLMFASDDLTALIKQYLKNQCSLLQIAKRESSNLFDSVIPPNLKKDQADEMKSNFEDLQRAIFANAESIRAQTFLHVKSFHTTQAGYKYLLVWSKNMFDLWCKWISKKLLRELDILQRKRLVSSEDTNELTLRIKEVFEQGEEAFKDELLKKAVLLQKETTFDNWNIYEALGTELRTELQQISVDQSQGNSKPVKDAMEFIKKRCSVYMDKTKMYGEKTEEREKETMNKALEVIQEVRSYQIKDIIGNIELLIIKYFSRTHAVPKKAEGKGNPAENGSVKEHRGSKEDAMRTLLESLEDIQADCSETETITGSSTEDYFEEVQTARADIQNLVALLLQQSDKFGEEPLVYCRFQLKSLLYFLRELSLPKIKSTVDAWSSYLQLTLTEVFVRNELKHCSPVKPDQSTTNGEDQVIFWFKSLDSITSNEFEKSRKQFRIFVDQQKEQLHGIFNEQIECLNKISKDYIFNDLQEYSNYVRRINSLKTEFLIVHQFLVKALHVIDSKQHLSDPEVRNCFVKFEKATNALTSEDQSEEKLDNNKTRKEVRELLKSFQKDCESFQLQQNLGTTGKLDELLFDEEGIVDKIMSLIRSKQQQDFQIDRLEKLQAENLSLLANLRKIDKLPDSTLTLLVNVLHSHVTKERLDEMMTSIDGPSGRNYYSDLVRSLVNEDHSNEKRKEDDETNTEVPRENKKRKKGKKKKKNVVDPNI